MGSCRKKQRCGDDYNTGVIPKSSVLKLDASCEGTIAEFPSLVLTVFIENVTNVGLLKKCRLVCRTWNIVATKVLQEKTLVYVDEFSGSSSKDFLTLVANRAIGNSALPSPFEKFRVRASTFSDDCFNRITILTVFPANY
ncbi:unnamed protein product [Allacma fusca]|uniref:F-box domain-containing protein n=1 Tax=Allacma fusca TaxID=39272 RepID=A0A8J2LVF7_9HEXA|nr:unnamed protein product [Allacma fusca]